MKFHWLIRTLKHYRLPAQWQNIAAWGSMRERALYNKFSAEKRRREWLLGRLTAKELIQRQWYNNGTKLAFDEIEIDNGSSGKPYFLVQGVRQRLNLSISHCRELAFCAVSTLACPFGMGVDVEYTSDRPSLFVDTFYREREKFRLKHYRGQNYSKAVTASWSLKESALKALGVGLREDTRKISVSLSKPPWKQWMPQKLEVDFSQVMEVNAAMRFCGNYVFTWVEIHRSGEMRCDDAGEF